MIPKRSHSMAVTKEFNGNPESAINSFNRTPSGVEDSEDTARNGTDLGSESSQL